MRVTRYTDYSIRVLIYLAMQDNRLATIQEIADSYDISRNHLMKIVHQLNRNGYIQTVRGKKGGMRLHMAPADINIGVLVRETEQDMSIVECFSAQDACRISPICGLKGMLGESLDAFMKTLDQYTLEDVIPRAYRSELLRILQVT